MGQYEALLNRLGGEKRAKAFLAGQLVVVSPDQVIKPAILKIDRSKPFDPAISIGTGWTIWRGPKNGNGLEGDEEQDGRSLAITELDPTRLISQTGFKKTETSLVGEVRLARLTLRAIQADAKIAETLLSEKDQITLKWLEKTLDVAWIEFLGTILRNPDGNRYSLYLYRSPDGSSWLSFYRWLGYDRDALCSALGFASN